MSRSLLSFLLLSGCVNAPIKLPEQSCPKLELKPVPQKVYLDIQGDKIMYDDGGLLLLRGYVAARAALK